MCLSDEEFTDTTTMNYEDIKKLLKDNKSFLNGKIKDVDGVEIDPADAINLAALLLGISPQVLLTTLQKERGAIKAKTRLADDELKTIMGYDTANPTTIREQIYDAAGQMRRDFDRLTNGQSTAGGWKNGVAKNSLDPLTITPANKAVAILFSYTPWVGKEWGGRKGGNALFCQLWEQFEFGIKCRPEDTLTIIGSETIIRNSSAQYTTSGCPSNVEWTVSGTGVSITQAGVLSASGSACGSLLVTATCAACGTFATHSVRVADAGQWVQINSCGSPGVGTIVTTISGRYKYEDTWCGICNCCPPPGPTCDLCETVFPTTCPQHGANPGSNTTECQSGGEGVKAWCKVNGNLIYEWQCP